MTLSFSKGLRRLVLVAAIAATTPMVAQVAGAQDVTVPRDSAPVAAAAADVNSVGAILHAAYDAISGPAGQRNWSRFYSLFAPGARLIPTRRDSTGTHVDAVTPEQFAQRAQSYFAKNPFYEAEIGRQVDTFGAITQVFDTYASKHAPSDAKPFARGINSFQLFNDGKRWYIVTIYWDDEKSGQTIPPRYLHAAS